MKLVETDNYGGDYPYEKFLCIGSNPMWLNPVAAKYLVTILNKLLNPTGDDRRYWKTVEDDYKLDDAGPEGD